ncbi:MAG TPA: SH3 domain-containing protein, partial [Trichocoleus sp.]
MKGFLVGLSKLVLGVMLALLLLSLAGVATARYFMARLAILPTRPTYENDVPPPQATNAPTAAVPVADTGGSSTPQEAAAPTPKATPTPALEEGDYEAVVVQPIGLVLREGPGTTFAQLGGIDYNDQIVVLEESPDKQWVKVRVTDGGQEGWI